MDASTSAMRTLSTYADSGAFPVVRDRVVVAMMTPLIRARTTLADM